VRVLRWGSECVHACVAHEAWPAPPHPLNHGADGGSNMTPCMVHWEGWRLLSVCMQREVRMHAGCLARSPPPLSPRVSCMLQGLRTAAVGHAVMHPPSKLDVRTKHTLTSLSWPNHPRPLLLHVHCMLVLLCAVLHLPLFPLQC